MGVCGRVTEGCPGIHKPSPSPCSHFTIPTLILSALIIFFSVFFKGLTITSARVSQSSVTSNGFPLQELTGGQQMVFDVTFGTDPRYGSVRGSDLWVLRVAISNAPSPDITTLNPAPATLTMAQRNLDVEGGNDLSFLDTTVSLHYLHPNVIFFFNILAGI